MSSVMNPNQEYCLRWNNHRSNLLNVFDDLLHTEAFTDVSLALDNGRTIKCHKIVLAACSSYFQNLFLALPPTVHPVIVLKDVKHSDLKAILEYIYRGEVNVHQEKLASLLKVAQMLQVKGLVEHTSSSSNEERSSALDFRCRGQDDVMETSLSPPPAISTSTNTSSNLATVHSSDYTSPHSTGGSYGDLYSKSSGSTISRIHDQLRGFPIWSLPTSLQHEVAQASLHRASILGVASSISYDNGYDNSSLKADNPSLKRIKKTLQSNLMTSRDTPILRTVLGQGHVDSSVQGLPLLQPDSHEPIHFRASSSNGSANDTDNRHSSFDLTHEETAHSSYADAPLVEEDMKQLSPQSHLGDTKLGISCRRSPSGNASCIQPKPEWKRYKQYTRDDIASAIDAVKKGMSAVQAAKKFSVPSRTLYDKVKKLGIPTSRPSKRSSVSNGSAACFPYGIGGNVNGSIYNSSSVISENENDTSSNANAENTASSTSNAGMFDVLYGKSAKDAMSQDSVSETMARCSLTPSPSVHCAKQKQPRSDDEVEDLSVSRKSDVPVIVHHLTSSDVKDEPKETTDNNDCSYN